MTDDKVDYLDVDEPIPGQNYVCLSFVSPEALMQEKEKFKTAKFLQSYCKDKKLEFNKLYEEYKDFTYKFNDNLQRDFDEANKFQTNIRGIKIRGVYENKESAEKRAKKLQGAHLAGKDVDHKDGNPLNNSPSNLRVLSIARNRSRKA